MNPTLRMDKLDVFGSYSLLRGDQEFSMKYDCKHSILGCPFSLSWKRYLWQTEFMFREYMNRLKESSVNIFTSGVQASISDFKKRFQLGFGLQWRDLSPFGDIEELCILKTQCSSSMLKECRPSIKSTLGFRYHYGTYGWILKWQTHWMMQTGRQMGVQ